MVKKSIKTILLSSGACLLASLLTFGLHEEKASVVSATSFNEIETTAFCHIAGAEASTDVHFVINLTEANFGEATRLSYSTYESKISALDFASHIYLNGCPMSFDSFNDEGFKFSSDDNLRFNVHEPQIGTFSIRINFAAGKTYDNISTVTIDKGCLFPSLDYMTSTSTDVYSIASKLSANRADANYGWVTYMDTEVYKISTVANTYLGLSLTISDYPTDPFSDGSVGNTFTNYRNHITLNENVEMAVSDYGLFCYENVPNSVWVRTTANTSSCTEVTISEGLIISSYHKVKATPWWPLFFKITNTHTFTKSDVTGEWPQVPVYIETEVEEVNISSINALWLSFRLTNSDYSTSEQNSYDKSSYYNLWDNIALIKDTGTSHTPSDIAKTYAHIFNFNNAHPNEIAINFKENPFTEGGSIKKVVIPAGTEFPEYAYIKGTNTGRPKCYITTEEKSFIFGESQKPYANVEKTTVTGMGYNKYGYLHFILSNNDYPAEGETTGRIGDNSGPFIDFKTKIDLDDIGLKYTEDTDYCLWSYTPYAGSIAPAVDDTLKAGYITIPKGTVFPSYAYSSGSSTDPLVYETSEDALFHYDGTKFESLYDNTIKSVGYLDAGGTDICIYFRFTIKDWPDASVIKDKDIQYEIDCADEFLNNIEVIDVNDVAHAPLNREVFVNVWGTAIEEASFGFRTNLSLTDIKSVVVHEGCTFPTYDRYNDAEKDYWYKFHETKFYSSKDYSFYLGTNLTAKEYASEFNSAFSAVCSEYDGYSSNKGALENKFYAFKNIYDSELTTDVKAQLNAGSSDVDVSSMIETYSYVVAKYALTDFLDLGINVSGSNTLIKTIINNSNVTEIIAIVSIAAVAIIAVGGYFYFNKKKEDK